MAVFWFCCMALVFGDVSGDCNNYWGDCCTNFHLVDGRCVPCPAGQWGDNCEKVCMYPYYGVGCQHTFRGACQLPGVFDPALGCLYPKNVTEVAIDKAPTCQKCPVGTFGPFCEYPCPYPYYGQDCGYRVLSPCPFSSRFSPVSGCVDRDKWGYYDVQTINISVCWDRFPSICNWFTIDIKHRACRRTGWNYNVLRGHCTWVSDFTRYVEL